MSKERNNQIKIRYNPYLKTIQYRWRSSEGWEPLDDNSPLSKDRFQRGTLQHHAAEILETIWKEYCELGADLELIFEGTQDDWMDINCLASQYPGDRLRLRKQVTCGLTPVSNALKRIETIFSSLSGSIASHGIEDSRIQDILDSYTRTMRPEIPICVMGTYSAGKSSFINALIGEEILPSAKTPTTAKVFKIIPMSGGNCRNTRIRFQYAGVDTEIVFSKKGYLFQNRNKLPDSKLKEHLDKALSTKTMSPAYIYQTIAALNQFKQNTGSQISDLIEIETPFPCSTLPLDVFQFAIYDTPGPNSSTHKDHKEVLKNALKEQTDGLPIILTTSAQMDSDDARDLIGLVQELGSALDGSSTMAIIGQADELVSSDIEAVKASQSAIMDKLPQRIFFLSSILGLGSKKEDMEECVYDNDRKVFRNEKADCISGRTKLYEHNDLTKERVDYICKAGSAANAGTDDRAKLLHNSGLWAVENEIATFAKKYAAYNKCRQAQEYLAKAIGLTECAAFQKREEQKEKLDLVEGRLTAKKQALVALLQDAMKRNQTESFDAYTALNLDILQKYIPSKNFFSKEVKTAAGKLVGSEEKGRFPPLLAAFKFVDSDEKDRISKMRKWANEKIQTVMSSWQQEATEETRKFWAEKINAYKKSCIRIVNESDALTENEKSFMGQSILNCPDPNIQPVSSIDDGQISAEKWFLIFKIGTEFDSEKCTESIIKKIEKAIKPASQSYGAEIYKIVNHWTEDFLSSLMGKLAEFNPDLRKFTEELNACRAQLQQLEETRQLLEESKQEIKNLFKFDDER